MVFPRRCRSVQKAGLVLVFTAGTVAFHLPQLTLSRPVKLPDASKTSVLRVNGHSLRGTRSLMGTGRSLAEHDVAPLTEFELPPPPPPQRLPASLGGHISTGFKQSVAEAGREGGMLEAAKVALRGIQMIIDFSLLGPLSQIPMGARVLSFYFSDKLWGQDEGILRDVQYGARDHQKLDIFRSHRNQDLNSSTPFVMFVHGGSWASGNKWHYALQAERMRKEGAVVANVGYGLYPSQGFEGMCDDVNAALDWALSGGAAEHGADPGNVILCAHSAGAHISALAMIQRAGRAADALREGGEPPKMPAKLVLVSGVYDIPRHYNHEKSRGVHLFSPMHVAAGSTVEAMNGYSPTYLLSQELAPLFPPCAILHSQADTIVPYASSRDMMAALQSAGVEGCAIFDMGEAAGHNEFIVETMRNENTQGAQLFLRECTRSLVEQADPAYSVV